MIARRHKIAQAFAGAAEYDRRARVQRRVAEDLAARLAALPLSPAARILEIGCGTGFLTEAAARHGVAGEWLATDLSREMVERCRARMEGRGRHRFAVLDGESGARPDGPPFDLICASLAVQWFADLPAAVSRLVDWLAPTGHLLFTTLAAGTFAQWRQAHREAGLPCGTLPLPEVAALQAMHAPWRAQPHRVRAYVDRPGTARGFLRDLKAIGAATPVAAHRPLSPKDLRTVMRGFENAGAQVTYEVVTCHYRAAGAGE